MASDKTAKQFDPLAMQIYVALLGNNPKVARRPTSRSRLRFHVHFETHVEPDTETAFRVPTLKESIERVVAGAVSALNDAGDRLGRSRAKVQRVARPSNVAVTRAAEVIRQPSPEAPSPAVAPKPIVLVGSTSPRVTQRAAVAASRSAAA